MECNFVGCFGYVLRLIDFNEIVILTKLNLLGKFEFKFLLESLGHWEYKQFFRLC